MTREQMEQFVKKYEKVKSGPAGPGREIQVKPGERGEDAKPSANLPGINRQDRYFVQEYQGQGHHAAATTCGTTSRASASHRPGVPHPRSKATRAPWPVALPALPPGPGRRPRPAGGQ